MYHAAFSFCLNKVQIYLWILWIHNDFHRQFYACSSIELYYRLCLFSIYRTKIFVLVFGYC